MGRYLDQNAVAVGYSKVSDSYKVIIKVTGTANIQGDFNFSTGVGFQWK